MRRRTSEMFVNLGRRNQNLVARQLKFIDSLERSEADAERLSELFRWRRDVRHFRSQPIAAGCVEALLEIADELVERRGMYYELVQKQLSAA